ncbi:MAG: T9SS type A sorting domain-containing protein [Saprospiraceae bacterium]|nr:T9SS type A sorting domain-containing protein [Saprospiraceae bacterium]
MKNSSSILALWCFCCIVTISFSQVAPDEVWLVGAHDLPGRPGYGNALVRFSTDGVQVEQVDLRMNIESTVATMPDENGNLLFFTNGCYVASSHGDTMLNGAGLNPGEMADWTCSTAGYASPKGAMALQLPGSERLYYLFHMGVRYSPELKISYGPFYYTLIDMSLDNGRGGVVSKNNILVDGYLEPFSAVRHGNGRDWWIVVPEYESNLYHKFLLSPQGIYWIENQEIGPALQCTYIGSSVFSPTGNRYARTNNCGVAVMRFDRCSGVFSNDQHLALPPNVFAGGGVAFNFKGDRLVVSTQLSVQAADLTLPNPELDTIVTTLDAAGASLHLMQYAPDDKIYLSNLARGRFFHVIHQPNEQDIAFEKQGLPLPVYSVRSLPNNPSHKLLDAPHSACDTLGIDHPTSSIDLDNERPSISVNPNPAKDIIRITASFNIETIIVLNALGETVFIQNQMASASYMEVNVGGCLPGLYVALVRSNEHMELVRFIVSR